MAKHVKMFYNPFIKQNGHFHSEPSYRRAFLKEVLAPDQAFTRGNFFRILGAGAVALFAPQFLPRDAEAGRWMRTPSGDLVKVKRETLRNGINQLTAKIYGQNVDGLRGAENTLVQKGKGKNKPNTNSKFVEGDPKSYGPILLEATDDVEVSVSEFLLEKKLETFFYPGRNDKKLRVDEDITLLLGPRLDKEIEVGVGWECITHGYNYIRRAGLFLCFRGVNGMDFRKACYGLIKIGGSDYTFGIYPDGATGKPSKYSGMDLRWRGPPGSLDQKGDLRVMLGEKYFNPEDNFQQVTMETGVYGNLNGCKGKFAGEKEGVVYPGTGHALLDHSVTVDCRMQDLNDGSTDGTGNWGWVP